MGGPRAASGSQGRCICDRVCKLRRSGRLCRSGGPPVRPRGALSLGQFPPWCLGPRLRGQGRGCEVLLLSFRCRDYFVRLLLSPLWLLFLLLFCHLLSRGRVAVQTSGSQLGTADRISGSGPCPHFRACLRFWDDFRAVFPHPHWLTQWHNYDHIPQAAGAAVCLLVVKDLLSIHQPPLFFPLFSPLLSANYILQKKKSTSRYFALLQLMIKRNLASFKW